MNWRYNEEPVKINKWNLNLALQLREQIHSWKITREQANKILNNPLILI